VRERRPVRRSSASIRNFAVHRLWEVLIGTEMHGLRNRAPGCPDPHLAADAVMPDRVNGIALSRMARLRRRYIKVVDITGYNIAGVDREALGPILRKPVDKRVIEELGRVLAE
jgi:hypothetical protein